MRKIKIGLALGSGAARGWSHIGVINALKKVLKLISLQDAQLVRWWARPMHAIDYLRWKIG
jgi:hypothetical protein